MVYLVMRYIFSLGVGRLHFAVSTQDKYFLYMTKYFVYFAMVLQW
jgi:hypothetical protein